MSAPPIPDLRHLPWTLFTQDPREVASCRDAEPWHDGYWTGSTAPPPDAPLLARLLRVRRRQLGQTARQLGEAAGVNPALFNQLETGRRAPQQWVALRKIAAGYQLPVELVLAAVLADEGLDLELLANFAEELS